MFNHYVNCIKKYVQFSGCSTRSEYWYFVLANFIIALLVNIFAGLINVPSLALLYALFIFLPGFSAAARRLHDAGFSAWFMLLSFVPFVGAIALLVMMCMPTKTRDNKYAK
ncbi:MAG: DUF805 domain-containing protein [Alphaproteobacteria bacterium]|nr:DUF805 domain-containing protein [Alphaproteobacteria bacterium]